MSNSIVASVGLVSDTHYQERLFDLPVGLQEQWADIDLILHAGDIGNLEMLDLLGAFAPTVAVHGNDEPERVKEALPYQQLVTVHGARILLWHSHYADPIAEQANRNSTWGPKLERIAKRGRAVNARIVVYGHTHVPMSYRQDEVVLINPGALASGSYFTRQAIQSVGTLQFHANGEMDITHFDVATNRVRVFDEAHPDDDFSVLAEQYQDWIVEPDLIPVVDVLRNIAYEDVRSVVRTVIPLYKQCLSDGLMRREDLIRTINSSDLITPNDKQSILDAINQRV